MPLLEAPRTPHALVEHWSPRVLKQVNRTVVVAARSNAPA